MTLVSEYLHMLEDRKYMPKEIIVIYFLNAEKRLFNLPVPVLHYLFITPVTWSFFNLISKPEMFVYLCSNPISCVKLKTISVMTQGAVTFAALTPNAHYESAVSGKQKQN